MGDMSVKNLLGNSNSVRIRRCVLILLDLALLYIAIELAVVLRYDGAISPAMRIKLDQRIPLLMVLYTGALIVGGVYHMMWRYAGAPRAVPPDVSLRGGHGRGACMQPRVRLEDAALAVFADRHL